MLLFPWGDCVTTGELIKKARKDCGLTQRELGDRLGVSASMVGQYETDRRKPKHETIQKIADALHISQRALYNPKSWIEANGDFFKKFSTAIGTLQAIYENDETSFIIKKLIDESMPEFYITLDELCSEADAIVHTSIGTSLNENQMAKDSDEFRLLCIFRSLNTDGKQFALDYIFGLLENKRYNQLGSSSTSKD